MLVFTCVVRSQHSRMGLWGWQWVLMCSHGGGSVARSGWAGRGLRTPGARESPEGHVLPLLPLSPLSPGFPPRLHALAPQPPQPLLLPKPLQGDG